MNHHHNKFVGELRACQEAAGGPVSMTQFLRLSDEAIAALRGKGVRWNWIACRVVAVYQTSSSAVIPEDIPDARRNTSRRISSLWSRVTTLSASETDIIRETEPHQQDRFTGVDGALVLHPSNSINGGSGKAPATGPPKQGQSNLFRIIEDHEAADQLGRF